MWGLAVIIFLLNIKKKKWTECLWLTLIAIRAPGYQGRVVVSVWEERKSKKEKGRKHTLHTEASFIYTLHVPWVGFNKCVVKSSGCFTRGRLGRALRSESCQQCNILCWALRLCLVPPSLFLPLCLSSSLSSLLLLDWKKTCACEHE